ncbi:3-deoxy-manno-octulosonate cytidylyltransferase [Vibrio tasmaniensis ZS-17]|uniref:3-deoxy-manno-octulosonate cytidylyltransferase n=1 Tax=Vibrio tasmaniensis TaxID=212663 RepID=UPI0002FCB7ED|nr:3-deoxy-manno-octulosonate cytidylyltransferase [Vibrio tasmaniensis]OED64306.1 3-deoxy-manno-octulosonate cytidylyltransferase [Vibrio tasmaniensis ZS-17]
MNVKIVIPARFGSTRLPGKSLLTLLDKPVVLHVVDRCIEAGISRNDIFVATDDIRIENVLSESGIQVVMTSSSHQSGTDRINEVVVAKQWSDDTVVLNVQGDEPMIPPELIKSVVSFANKNPNFEISTAVVPLTSDEDFSTPNVVKAILGHNGRAIYFTRTAAPMNRDNPQDLSLAKRHIGIYAYRVSALKQFCSFDEDSLESYEKLEQLRALSHGLSIGAVVYEGDVPHGIDTEYDFENIKSLMNRRVIQHV